jgi:hypothetical protein
MRAARQEIGFPVRGPQLMTPYCPPVSVFAVVSSGAGYHFTRIAKIIICWSRRMSGCQSEV